ncbi:hypothetical protein Srot_2373 [Segniliparus rotundus DSM 44985]|uniref:Uncharacterized protein n=1 Tax=Segniliparus rotundus (strain ATCC BAA-972 / CDC 1076 / CIP 108378 / DSM 44985 / JCM 13578) TaxID=640132 RepID=D6ZAT2_SEGRD|nr:hypothetical protein [Segniliparus rotundus]ADG98818.1 hypothetical protein Srot_2373 [Segniliparus rotundus DSM 44985]
MVDTKTSSHKPPLLRIVRITPVERFSWLICSALMLLTGAVFLPGEISVGKQVLLWVLVVAGIKMTVISAFGSYPLPRWLAIPPN